MTVVDCKWIKEELDKELGVCQHCIHSPFDTCIKRKTIPKKKCKYFFRKRITNYDGEVQIRENEDDSRLHTHILQLFEKCPFCNGEIGHYSCNACKGKGKVPTAEGKDLLKFIKEYLDEY